jgi:cytoskeletal protein CcmA (bactofilin family)
MAGYIRQSSFSDGDTITAALFNNEYNQILNAFSNTSGHAHDGTAAEGPVIGLIGDAGETAPNNKVLIDTTNNYIEFYVQVSSSPVQQLYIADGAIVPVTDSDIDLGTTSLRFKDTYTDTITTTGNVSVGGNLTVTGTTTFNGGTITMGDAATDNVVFGADVDSNIIPDDDDTYDLGSSSQQWRNLYIDGTAEIDTLAINGTTVTSTAAELNILDGVTSTAAELNILDGVTASAADINLIDGITNGTVIASKAIITDSNKDITGGRNITISGELDAATLDISGDADIDGTLEADAITIAGVTLAETISDTVGAMVGSNTETGISVTYDDSDNTLDFVIGADSIVSSMLDTNIDIAGTLDVTGVLTADTNATIAGTLGIAGGSTNGVAISQGAIAIKNGGSKSRIDLYCESSNAHYTRIEAAAHAAYSGNVTVTLPTTTGTLALTSSDITGTAAVATAVTVSANNSTDETVYPLFVDGATGTQGAETDTGLSYNPSSGNLTIGGELSAATLDISGNVDVDGTLEADAITVNGTTLAETISDTVGAMVSSNTETGIEVTYDDSDNTLDFVIGSDVIVNSMIADDAIDSAQIADGSIDTAHIADDQVTGAKLSNDVTIANDLTVAGNLVVTGSTTQTGSIVSNSNFQSLANNNSGNATDFGFFGKYVESSTTKYAGLFYDASDDNTFRLFVDTQTEPSTTVNTGATGYAVGTLVANVTGNVSGTAATVTGAAQSNITSLGTLTTLTVDNVIINGSTIGHTGDTDLITVASGVVTVAGEVDATSLDISGDIDVDGTSNLDNTDIDGTLNTSGVVTCQTSANISQVALSNASSVAWDTAAAANSFLGLNTNSYSGNVTMAAPSNAVEGAIISVEIAQDGTPRTVSWNTIFEFAASTAPTVTATANKTDIFSFRYNGSVWQEIGRVQNMAQT